MPHCKPSTIPSPQEMEWCVDIQTNFETLQPLTHPPFMKPTRIRNTIVPSLCVFFLAIIGCGDGKMPTQMVEGLVTLDGVPLAGASILFNPVSEGTAAVGRSDDQGRFTLQTQQGAVGRGTTEGEYIVTVMKVELVPTGRAVRNEEGGGTSQEYTERSVVPALYNTTATSPFKVTIVRGLNQVELVLTSQP